MAFIEEPHFTRSRQRFRFLSLNSDKLIQLVSDVVNSYQDGGFRRQEFYRDIRDHHPIDVSSMDKEFTEELENGAGIIYMRGKYLLNMNRLLMLMNMFLKEIERVDKDRADELRQTVYQIHTKINILTGEAGVTEVAAKPKLPEYEEIEEEEPTAEIGEAVSEIELETTDKALTTYIKEYDKLSFIQIASVLGISEDEVRQRLSYMLDQGLVLGTIQDDYFIREAVSTIPTPTALGEIEVTSEVTEPITVETTPTEEMVTVESMAETEVFETPVVGTPIAEVVEEPVVEVVEEEVVYTKQEVKEIYKRMKLFIEMVSQVLEMVVVPDKPGFTMKDLSKLVYDYYFLPIDGSFDVEPFMELDNEGVVKVEEEWIRINLEKSLSLFKNEYIPGIRKVKKRTASRVEKALKEHIEQYIDEILSQSSA
ncbi:MAG: PCI domain-containing protein [Candidatus Lokiarchaeia archaeon]